MTSCCAQVRFSAFSVCLAFKWVSWSGIHRALLGKPVQTAQQDDEIKVQSEIDKLE